MDTNELINNLINNITDGEQTKAQEDFEAIISSKLQAAIDSKKLEVAQSIYGNKEAEETEEPEEDEEIEIEGEPETQAN